MDTTVDSTPVEAEDIQVQAIRGLLKELPMNDFGLPIGIYRVDMLPFHDYKPTHTSTNVALLLPSPSEVETPGSPNSRANGSPSETESTEVIPALPLDAAPQGDSPQSPQTQPTEYRVAGFRKEGLQSAFVPLQYDEGYPAFESGRAFWDQLDSEPPDVYRAFTAYLQMSLGRPSDPGDHEDPDDEGDPGKAADGSRSISTLVSMIHPRLNDAELLPTIEAYKRAYHIYYWGLRTRAYDLFRVAQHRSRQELRAIETQDEHYIESRRIRHRLAQYMNDDEEFWDLMTPKVAIDLLKLTTGLERISAGIPAAGPLTAQQEDRSGQSLEIAFRTVAQSNRASTEGATVDEEGEVLDKALEDADAVRVLQELIIKRG